MQAPIDERQREALALLAHHEHALAQTIARGKRLFAALVIAMLGGMAALAFAGLLLAPSVAGCFALGGLYHYLVLRHRHTASKAAAMRRALLRGAPVQLLRTSTEVTLEVQQGKQILALEVPRAQLPAAVTTT